MCANRRRADEEQKEETAVNDHGEAGAEDKTSFDAGGDVADEPVEATEEDRAGEYEALYDKHLRLSAEFDNYKKRMARERDAYLQFANERILMEWLPVVDNIERALHHAKELNAPEPVVDGWALILKQCQDLMERAGVTAIDSVGRPFNPELHQAIAQRESADHDDQTVLEEAQRGYLLKGRMLRPSLVTVARQPGSETDE